MTAADDSGLEFSPRLVLRTTPDSFPTMVNWYKNVLQSDVVFENEFVCFMYYDDEHHRIGIGCGPGIGDRPLNCKGVDHIAFAYETVSELVTTYERPVVGAPPPPGDWPVPH